MESIELIPPAYLYPQGSFGNLEQLRSLHGIDVIALISFDQVRYHDQSAWSIAYWTIVGAYLIAGERNDTNTLLDAAVFHIPSRQLLFRAPGISQVKETASLINMSEKTRAASLNGFHMAADHLVGNLAAELARFQEKLKTSPAKYEVVHRPGYTGGGSIGEGFAKLLFFPGRTRVMAPASAVSTSSVPWLTLTVVATAAAVFCAGGLSDLLVYDRQLVISGEWWRPATAFLVHFSADHLQWNLAVLAAAGMLAERRGRRRFALVLALSAVLPGFYYLTFDPACGRFGGLSGIVTGIVVWLGMTEVRGGKPGQSLAGLALLVVVVGKIVLEGRLAHPLFAELDSAVVVATPAHWIGLVAGATLSQGDPRLPEAA